MCELGHKRGQCGQMQGDVGLCCMSCDAHMHGVAAGNMQSGVRRMVDELGPKTSILEHGLVKFLILFF